MKRRFRRAAVAATAALAALIAAPIIVSQTSNADAATASTLPPIKHVWMIVLENENEQNTFGDPGGDGTYGSDPYLTQTLPGQGAFLPNYFGIGHSSLDNYIAQISGQAPNPETQTDCSDLGYTPFIATALDPNQQVVGEGCEFPTKTDTGSTITTLPQQLTSAGDSWKGYMQGMGDNLAGDGAVDCAHPTTGESSGGEPNPQGEHGSSNFAVKHDPFAYFDGIIDNPASCRKHVVPLDPSLASDLQSVGTTPNFSYITPDLVFDGHDTEPGESDLFLRKYVAEITASPAYRQDGMIVVTYDESGGTDTSCCNEIPGPDSPDPGEGVVSTNGSGIAGGGQIGADVLSPFIKPGTVDTNDYDHYSLLGSIESLFGVSKIGLAGASLAYAGPGSFGCDLFTDYGPCESSGSKAVLPVAPKAKTPNAPRPATSGLKWLGPQGDPSNLSDVTCANSKACIAVGDTGTVELSIDQGQKWAPLHNPSVANLSGIACTTRTSCLAVGAGGVVQQIAARHNRWTVTKPAHVTKAGAALSSISCGSSTDCVTVGNNVILHSSNAGKSWSDSAASLPALGPGATPDLLSVSCPTTTACYSVGSLFNTVPNGSDKEQGKTVGTDESVFSSTDGGTTWKSGDAGGQRLHAINCTSAIACVAVGEDGVVEQTIDGTTWRVEAVAAPTPVAGSKNPLNASRDSLDGIACGGSNCVIVGKRPNAGDELTSFAGYGKVQSTVLSTTLGLTPVVSVDASHTDDDLAAVTCLTKSHCIAVGEGGTISTGAYGAAGWTLRSGGLPDSINAVACHGQCVAVGGSSTLLGQQDGGTTRGSHGHWGSKGIAAPRQPVVLAKEKTLKPPSTTVGASLRSISCPLPGKCVGVGDNGIVGRRLGGKWKSAVVSAAGATKVGQQGELPNDDLRGVSCADAHSFNSAHCLAVGDHGAVISTSDGGLHWTAHPGLVSTDLSAVACSSESSCLAVGSLGQVDRFASSKGTWHESTLNSPTAQLLDGIACASGSQCLAVGASGTVLRINGSSIKTVKSGVTAELNAVSFTGSRAVAVGSNGTVISSSKSGASWNRIGTGTAIDLMGIGLVSSGGWVAVGENGGVLRDA